MRETLLYGSKGERGESLSYPYRILFCADVSLAISLADRLLSRYGEGTLKSISFDKGFYKKENKELLSLYIPEVIMPKTCPRENGEGQEE